MTHVWTSVATLIVSITTLLVGCTTAQMARDRTARDQPVVIKLSGWGSSPEEQALLKRVLRDFEAKHPGIRVQYETIADQYMDVIKTRLIGEAAPDVFYLDVLEAPFLMSQNVLEPLDSYITPEIEIADFEPGLLNAFRYQGRLYGLPKDYSTLALFYNQQAFKAAGLTQPPRTWEELRAYAKQLTVDRDRDGRIDQYGIGVIPELVRQAFVIRAFGGRLVNDQGIATFASEAGWKGLQLIVDQYRQDRTSALKTDVGTNSGSEMFGQGKVAMVIEGSWAVPYLQETFPNLQFGTAEVPTINGRPGTMIFTVAYVMNRQSQHKAEAWQLIAYLTGKAGMQTWTQTGVALPTRRSLARANRLDQRPLQAAFVAGVRYGMPWQGGPYLSTVMTNFDNQFLSVMLGQQSLPQAMMQAQTRSNWEIQALEDR